MSLSFGLRRHSSSRAPKHQRIQRCSSTVHGNIEMRDQSCLADRSGACAMALRMDVVRNFERNCRAVIYVATARASAPARAPRRECAATGSQQRRTSQRAWPRRAYRARFPHRTSDDAAARAGAMASAGNARCLCLGRRSAGAQAARRTRARRRSWVHGAVRLSVLRPSRAASGLGAGAARQSSFDRGQECPSSRAQHPWAAASADFAVFQHFTAIGAVDLRRLRRAFGHKYACRSCLHRPPRIPSWPCRFRFRP